MPDNPSVPVYITEVKSVTSVRAGHGETVGTYKIQFSPEFAFSATGPYTGKFYVKLIPLTSSTQIGSTYEPQYIGNGATHEITATGLETGKRYKIVVSGSDDFAKSKNAIVTLREYAFPHMVFRNDNLTVKWQNNTKTHGMLSVSGDWDTAQPIPFGLAGFALPVTSEVYGEAHFKIKVAAAEESEGGTSLGPFSQEINAYFAAPKFTEAELSGGTLKITYDYSIAAHTVCLSLVHIGETPDTNALITPTATTAIDGSNYVSVYDISGYNLSNDYTGYLFARSNAVHASYNDTPLFVNYNITKANTFALSDPNVWKKGYYEVEISTGTPSTAKKYIMFAEQKSDLTATTVDYTLPLLVNFKAEKSIAVDGISLSKTTSAQTLTLIIDKTKPLTADNFKSFLTQLFDDTIIDGAIAPQSYYELRGIISRTAVFDAAEANYIVHGIGQISIGGTNYYSYEDLLPGVVLRVRTSGFRRQVSPETESLQGYYQDSMSDYYIEYNTAKQRLEFDTNLSLLVDKWTYIKPTDVVSFAEEQFGGAVDFALDRVCKPYARVISTGGFFSSSSLEDSLSPGTGMSVFFGDSVKQLNDVTTLIKVTLPNLTFRGRAALTVCVTVFFKGSPVIIPAGTTLKAFTLRYGIANPSNLVLQRRDYNGELVNVTASLPAYAEMPLAGGDMLS